MSFTFMKTFHRFKKIIFIFKRKYTTDTTERGFVLLEQKETGFILVKDENSKKISTKVVGNKNKLSKRESQLILAGSPELNPCFRSLNVDSTFSVRKEQPPLYNFMAWFYNLITFSNDKARELSDYRRLYWRKTYILHRIVSGIWKNIDHALDLEWVIYTEKFPNTGFTKEYFHKVIRLQILHLCYANKAAARFFKLDLTKEMPSWQVSTKYRWYFLFWDVKGRNYFLNNAEEEATELYCLGLFATPGTVEDVYDLLHFYFRRETRNLDIDPDDSDMEEESILMYSVLINDAVIKRVYNILLKYDIDLPLFSNKDKHDFIIANSNKWPKREGLFWRKPFLVKSKKASIAEVKEILLNLERLYSDYYIVERIKKDEYCK